MIEGRATFFLETEEWIVQRVVTKRRECSSRRSILNEVLHRSVPDKEDSLTSCETSCENELPEEEKRMLVKEEHSQRSTSLFSDEFRELILELAVRPREKYVTENASP